jgi:capsular polysaccharide biosynthesis protein/Mrp family chromosome partitioning ATPase
MSQPHPAPRGTRADERPLGLAADWSAEPARSHGLGFYLDLLRARLWLVALIVVITVVSAALFVAQTEKVYEAHADLLVTPIAADNPDFVGLGLVTESGDPTRDASTLAKLITSTTVADRVRSTLGEERSASALRHDVTAEPVAQSSIVTVTAKAGDPERAASLANEFAEGAIAVRTDRLRARLDALIPGLRRRLAALPPAEVRAREALSGRVQALVSLRAVGDPTLNLEAPATPPSSPVAPRPLLTMVASLLAALVLAFGIVLGAHFLDTRIEREEDLRGYRISVVGRIPRERRPLGLRAAIKPNELSSAARDAFHRLASSLAARIDERDREIFVTAPGPNSGKTTTSINLAASLATFENGVVLVDGDSRRPAVAQTLGVAPEFGLSDVVTGRASLADALVDADRHSGRIRVLAPTLGEIEPAPMSAEAADELIREATQRGSWLIVDGAALSYAPDSLPLAKRVANVLIVVHLRRTRVRDLNDLAELLTQQGITPDGFIVIGEKPRTIYR